MTPEAQNQAMAEDQGWKECTSCAEAGYKGRWRTPEDDNCQESPPDYGRDHGAMREAERTLTGAEAGQYREALMRVIIDQPHACPADDHAWHASPAQRREAFLKVKGLWKDETTK